METKEDKINIMVDLFRSTDPYNINMDYLRGIIADLDNEHKIKNRNIVMDSILNKNGDGEK